MEIGLENLFLDLGAYIKGIIKVTRQRKIENQPTVKKFHPEFNFDIVHVTSIPLPYSACTLTPRAYY